MFHLSRPKTKEIDDVSAPDTPLKKRPAKNSPKNEPSPDGVEDFEKRSQDLRTDEEKADEKRPLIRTPSLASIDDPVDEIDEASLDSVSCDVKPEPDSGRLTLEDLSTNALSGSLFFQAVTHELNIFFI